MVDRHLTTYDVNGYNRTPYSATYRSTGGTRVPAVRRDPPRNYFDESATVGTGYNKVWSQSNNRLNYYDSVDWYRPQKNTSKNATSAAIGSCYTGDRETTMGQNKPNYNYPGNTTARKTSPFACESLSGNSNSPTESTVVDLGNASSYFDQVTLKIFNNEVIPGYILHGIVYFDASEDVKINKIVLNGISNVTVSGDGVGKSEKQVNAFKKEIVTNTTGGKRRQPNEYNALTENWDGDNLMQTLELPVDCFPDDNLEWPFAGPITLPKGTHAIPFAVRIPPEVNPTLTYEKKGEKRRRRATVAHATNVGVEINAQPATGNPLLTVLSDKLALDVQSCGGLPPVVNGAYAPGSAQLVDLDYKSSKALIVLEKKHLLPGDTLRIFICTDRKRAVRRAYAELVASYNLPEIGCSDSGDVSSSKESASIRSLTKCKKKRLSDRKSKVFTSKVSDKYPTSDTNTTPAGRMRSVMDDKQLMPESSRKQSVWLELKVPTDTYCSIEAGEYRIRHHVRVHLYVRRKTKPESRAQMVTVADHLVHNYTVKYIKFVN